MNIKITQKNQKAVIKKIVIYIGIFIILSNFYIHNAWGQTSTANIGAITAQAAMQGATPTPLPTPPPIVEALPNSEADALEQGKQAARDEDAQAKGEAAATAKEYADQAAAEKAAAAQKAIEDQKAEAYQREEGIKQKENAAQQQQQREESIQGILNIINKDAQLPSFTSNIHRDAPSAPGARNIGSIIFYILDFVKYLIGGIVVFFIIIGAIQILLQSGDVDEVYKKQKNNIFWSIVGLIVITISDSVIKKVFYGERGEVLQDESSAKLFAEQGANTIRGIYTAAEIMVGGIALLIIIFHALRMIMVSQTEDEVGKSKKAVIYAVVGLAVIGISEIVIKGILFKEQGTQLGISEFQSLFIGITNFIASFIGILSLIMFIYAGITLVINAGNDEAAGKAKNIMKNTIIGILLALAAFAFTSTLIQFKP